MAGSGVLVVAATPIGNPLDASPRVARALAEADVVAAEDTRRLRRLCSDLGVTPRGRLTSLFEGNEAGRTEQLVDAVRGGSRVLLVTDAGTPLVSDPGYRLVAACAQAGLPVQVLPGPSAALAALVVSGLPTDRFAVEGFLPRRPTERDRRLAELAADPRTLVLFESPRRTARTLQALVATFGPIRPAALCRELTKTHEQVLRGSLADLAAATAQTPVLGEVTLVVGGSTRAEVGAADDPAELVRLVAQREAAGLSRKEAVLDVARESRRPRREVYAAVVAAKHAAGDSAAPPDPGARPARE